MTQKTNWNTLAYEQIVAASSDGETLRVRFADASEANVPVTAFIHPRLEAAQWSHLAFTPYEVIVPVADGQLELSWLAIRSASDPEFDQHLRGLADRSAQAASTSRTRPGAVISDV